MTKWLNPFGGVGYKRVNLLMIFFYAVLMFQYDIGLTLARISIALFNLLALRFVSRKRIDINQRLLQEKKGSCWDHFERAANDRNPQSYR